MTDDTLMAAIASLLQDPKRAGYAFANGAQNQADLGKWALGGMAGAPPAPYDGRLTPNQVVDLNYPRPGSFGSLAPGRP